MWPHSQHSELHTAMVYSLNRLDLCPWKPMIKYGRHLVYPHASKLNIMGNIILCLIIHTPTDSGRLAIMNLLWYW